MVWMDEEELEGRIVGFTRASYEEYYGKKVEGSFPIYKPPKRIIDNTITLRIELVTYLDSEPMFPLQQLFAFIADVQQPDWILKLYENRNVSGDLTIKIQDNEFRAHKQVLDQRGFVLNNATIQENNIFILSDLSPEIFGMLLEYVYTGAIKKLDDFAEPLLEAADRFELKDLKNLCEKTLAENYVDYNNFVDAYVLAKRCNAKELLRYARFMGTVLSQGDSARWSTNNWPTAEQFEKYALIMKKIREAEETSRAHPSDALGVLNKQFNDFSTNGLKVIKNAAILKRNQIKMKGEIMRLTIGAKNHVILSSFHSIENSTDRFYISILKKKDSSTISGTCVLQLPCEEDHQEIKISTIRPNLYVMKYGGVTRLEPTMTWEIVSGKKPDDLPEDSKIEVVVELI
ncbi:Similar to SPOPL: Speckle-type POZ protein-like (Homo sapiens) [Cotesia congregata]|uniref:Similar to SPOPL: Speckle-type POZ protein-like (Homo sapiens) n=1 Tax=Cotesia congregata TaxID=51543 RepID=A0A8J2MCU8_COTCN|nr:Similar to SPOPL: Speckle-type POZ protein-like (Homo sapiens) [Cotesia congregata]